MTAHSDWQELRGLSEQQRELEIISELHLMHSSVNDMLDFSSDFIWIEDYCIYLQQHLDRIKALVMSRGK